MTEKEITKIKIIPYKFRRFSSLKAVNTKSTESI